MRRLILFLLVSCLLLSGCSAIGERIKEPVPFYYVREDYQESMEQVILSEVREASGHRNDLPYLLALYSMGPTSEGLVSPFPKNTRMTLITCADNSIELSLSDGVLILTDAEFTLAGACIAKTCMELTDVEQVTIICGDRTITISDDNLLLSSDVIPNLQEETK
jgi:uncharacterized protein YceK